MDSLTGAVASQRVTEAFKGSLRMVGNHLYKGLGGEVTIPADKGITAIYQYAFSNYEYVPKTEDDEISVEDPFYIKPWYIGEDTITKVIIPKGVTKIGKSAFLGCQKLDKIKLPEGLVSIEKGWSFLLMIILKSSTGSPTGIWIPPHRRMNCGMTLTV